MLALSHELYPDRRYLLTVVMDGTVPITFLVERFWRRVIVVMDVFVCVWRLAVPVRILVNAVIGPRERKVQGRDRQHDRNNVNRKHVQKGIAKVVAGGHDRWNGSDVGGGMNVACVRDTPDRYFLITL